MESQLSSRYQYQPFTSARSIRVLIIAPSIRYNALVECQLIEESLDSKGYFEALSYVWGDPHPKQKAKITENSTTRKSSNSFLEVTPNCLLALKALRYRLKSRRVWIDSLCIDQSNIAEKSQQVSLMAEIYRSAGWMIIWLNPGDEPEKKLHEMKSLFLTIMFVYHRGLRRWLQEVNHPPRVDQVLPDHLKSMVKNAGDSFSKPFWNVYFSRVWTVQEIALASNITVYYGAAQIPWTAFVVSAQIADRKISPENADRDAAWKNNLSLQCHFAMLGCYEPRLALPYRRDVPILSRTLPWTVSRMLLQAKNLHATIPSDKVYAMIWAFEDSAETASLRLVDYDKPIEILFTEYTVAVLNKLEVPSELFHEINGNYRNPSLPSWVPDWEQPASERHSIWCNRLNHFCATDNKSLTSAGVVDGNTFVMKGIPRSTVRHVFSSSPLARQATFSGFEGLPRHIAGVFRDTTDLLKGLIRKSKSMQLRKRTEILDDICGLLNPDGIQVAIRKVNYDIGSHEEKVAARYKIHFLSLRLRFFDDISSLIPTGNELKVLKGGNQALEDQFERIVRTYLTAEETASVMKICAEISETHPLIAAFMVSVDEYIGVGALLVHIYQHQCEKDFFISESGRIGVSFYGIQVGDTVALMKGCRSPMILRKQGDDGGNKYSLHGPCEITGIMDGEAWPSNEEQLQEFVIV